MVSMIKLALEVLVGVVALIAVAGVIAPQSAGSVGGTVAYTIVLLIPTLLGIGLLYVAAEQLFKA